MTKKLVLIDSLDEIYQKISEYIKTRLRDKGNLRILEGGCGQRWPIDLKGLNYRLVGVDLSQDALDIRQKSVGDLDEVYLGDLRNIEFECGSFDIIYSSYVLEHIKNAETVLTNFVKWLKPGGVIVIQFPCNNTVQGVLTRNTPFWFHIFYKKIIQRRRMAGRAGHGPFQTYYNKILSRSELLKYCEINDIVIEEEIGWGGYLKNIKSFKFIIAFAAYAFQVVTFGRYSASYNNLTYILRPNK